MKNLKPFIKWAGGKEQELKHIVPNMPERIDRYIEPFVGGGAVFFAMENGKYFINDKSKELVQLYTMIKEQNEAFFVHLDEIADSWKKVEQVTVKYNNVLLDYYIKFKKEEKTEEELKQQISEFITNNSEELKKLVKTFEYREDVFEKELLTNLFRKMKRMKKLEGEKGDISNEDLVDNLEASLKGSFYMYFRFLYNKQTELGISKPFSSAIFYFIREYCYASMFRYNKSGEFNVPYGGISYNKKDFGKKARYLKSKEIIEHFANTTIFNGDFEEFLIEVDPKEDDFIFLDPPYDSEFSTYAKNSFGKEEQIRLADYFVNECKGKFMMVIKNTDFIFSLYDKKGIYIQSFDKKYSVSFQNRNNKDCEHLLITNYNLFQN